MPHDVALLSAPGGGAGVPLRELALLVLVSAAVSYLLTGFVRYLVVRSGYVDMPRVRDVHDIPKPRLGGVAMYSGILAAIWVARCCGRWVRKSQPMIDITKMSGLSPVRAGTSA